MDEVKVKIEHIVDFSVAGEKYLIFDLNGKTYEAFHNEGQEFKVDEEINAKLFLVDFKLKKVTTKKQFADYIKSAPLAANNYNIQGKVIEINKGIATIDAKNSEGVATISEGIAVIDAGKGLIISVKVPDSLLLKQNDYVYLEGRLDINKASDS